MSLKNLSSNQTRIINLFRNNYKPIDIAKKIRKTKQYISLFLKYYYKNKKPLEFRDVILKRKCKVCNIDEEIIIYRIPIYKIKPIRCNDIIIKYKNYVHPECKSLYRCYRCGTIGYYKFYSVHKSFICSICNTKNVLKWYHKSSKNKEKQNNNVKRWIINNKEHYLNKVKEWRDKNKDKMNYYYRQDYSKHKEQRLEYRKNYYPKRKESVNESS